jgi:hypothetical protein
MEIVSSSQYEADVQRAMGKSSVSGANGKGDPFEDFLSEDSSVSSEKPGIRIVPGIVMFTPADGARWEAIHPTGLLASSLERQQHHLPRSKPLELYGDSRDSALIPRAFGPYESEMMKIGIANAERTGFGLIPPESLRYMYHMPPLWYTDLLNAPLNAREQQEDDPDSSVTMDEEQAQALTAEYHQALGESLNQALDNLGIRENDFDGNYKALYSPKLREELSRIMNSDPRTKEVMSLLGVKV